MGDSNNEQENLQNRLQDLISKFPGTVAEGVIRGLEQSEMLVRIINALEAIEERFDQLESEIKTLKAAPSAAAVPGGVQSRQPAPKIELPRMESLPISQHPQVVTRRSRLGSRPTVTYRGSGRPTTPSIGAGQLPPFSTFSGPPASVADATAGQMRATESGICSVPGCGKPSRAKGLCSAHYQRQRYQERKIGPPDSETAEPPPPSPVVRPPAFTEARPVVPPTLSEPPPPRPAPPVSPPRKEGGTRGIFAVLYEDKGRKLLAGLINQMKYDRTDLVARLNKMHEGMPGVPLEEEDVLRAVHYHQLGDVLKKRESEVIFRHLEKLQGSLGKTAQRLRVGVDKLKARIDELGMQGEVSRIRNEFREQILEHQNFNQRLDLALTREKYLEDLGIEEEVDDSLRRELNSQVDKLGADTNVNDAGQTIRAALSLDEERFRRLVRRFGLAERFGLPTEPPPTPAAANNAP